jgi:hypothetical protein
VKASQRDAAIGAGMLRSILIAVFCVVAISCTAEAMTFRIERNSEEKINVIIGDGPIEDGDAQRLERIIPHADRDRYGNIPLYLNSQVVR